MGACDNERQLDKNRIRIVFDISPIVYCENILLVLKNILFLGENCTFRPGSLTYYFLPLVLWDWYYIDTCVSFIFSAVYKFLIYSIHCIVLFVTEVLTNIQLYILPA